MGQPPAPRASGPWEGIAHAAALGRPWGPAWSQEQCWGRGGAGTPWPSADNVVPWSPEEQESGDPWQRSGQPGVRASGGLWSPESCVLCSTAPYLCTRTQVHIDLRMFSEWLQRSAQCRHHELPLCPGDTPPLRTASHTGSRPCGQSIQCVPQTPGTLPGGWLRLGQHG